MTPLDVPQSPAISFSLTHPDHTKVYPFPFFFILVCVTKYYIYLTIKYYFQGFPFIIQQVKDNTNLHMTKNLIFSLCRNDSSQKNALLANEIVSQILNIIQKNVNNSEVRVFI